MIEQEQFVNFLKTMKVNIDKFTEEFQLKNFGAKGWRSSKFISCPHCGKDYSKFGILLLENGGVYKCFRCDSKGSIFKLLRSLGRQDLIIGNDETFIYKDKLDSFLKFTQKTELDLKAEIIKKPIGFIRVFQHDYLEKRGWREGDFEKIEVGISNFSRHKNRVIFLLREDDNLIGYISRSTYTKEWHDKNLKQYKESGEGLVLRYDNSKVEFEKIVGGINDIVEGSTHTVIITEGLFDKMNTDRVLGLDEQNEVKCVYTFGCHLSWIQLYKIYEKGVENIVLMFDRETIKQTKSVSLTLSNYFNIFISELESGRDPGEMNLDDFNSALNNLKNPIEYFVEKIEKIQLL